MIVMHSSIQPGDNRSNNGSNFKVNIARDVLFAIKGDSAPAMDPSLNATVPIHTFRLFFPILY